MGQWIFQLSRPPGAGAGVGAAQRGVALNDSPAGRPYALGYVYLCQKQYEQALAEMERAVALDPNGALTYAALAEVLSSMDRSPDAWRRRQTGATPEVHVVDAHLNSIGTAYCLAGRPEEAIAPLKQYLTRYPNILVAHLTLAVVYSELGQTAEARAKPLKSCG